MSSSTSVEVIATVAMDGSIRTRSVLVPEESLATSSLVDSQEEASKEDPFTSRHQPALVRVGSMSDSEDSNLSGSDDGRKEERQHRDPHVLQKCSTSNTEAALANNNAITTVDDGAVGMYDCLSDQFTNFFCSSEQPPNLCLQQPPAPSSNRSEPENPLSSINWTDAGCSEYQLQNLFGPKQGADVFSSLQFWLTPSQDEEKSAAVARQKPYNRSSGGRKRRSKHIEKIWKSWHGEQSIPLERSKSLPTELRLPLLSGKDNSYAKDVCYDSDPEQEHPHKHKRGEALRSPPKHNRPNFRNWRPLPINTLSNDENCYIGVAKLPSAPRNSTPANAFDFYTGRRESFAIPRMRSRRRSFDTPIGPTDFDLLNPEGEHIIRSFIQEATNTKIPLIWHRRSLGMDAVKRKPPLSVSCAFEVGAHLDNLVVQPKFTWRPSYEPDLHRRKIKLSGAEPDSIELLSIIRVVKPTQLNRNLYPFARLDRTCCITTNDEKFSYLVFEAPSVRERDWLVNAMKMIVARLASIIIVRDEAMLLEFFTPYAALMHLDVPAPKDEAIEKDGESSKPALDTNGELQLVSYGGI